MNSLIDYATIGKRKCLSNKVTRIAKQCYKQITIRRSINYKCSFVFYLYYK